MKARLLIVPGILGIAICGAANARSIVYDAAQYDLTPFSGTSSSLVVDGSAITFAPGTSTTSAAGGPIDPAYVTPPNTWEYNWGSTPILNNANKDNILEQVFVTSTSATSFTVDFNYLSSNCANETGTFSVGGTTWSSKNPCVNAGSSSTSNEFTVNNGKVVAAAGWNPGTKVAAPELDPNSAFSGLALLLGGIAVVLGRRPSSLVANRA
jgi:hypothetical protein